MAERAWCVPCRRMGPRAGAAVTSACRPSLPPGAAPRGKVQNDVLREREWLVAFTAGFPAELYFRAACLTDSK